MRIAGEATLHAPADQVWDALLDPEVLVRTIPGCERLESTAAHAYAMTVTAGVAAIKGSYAGTCSLHDLQPHSSLVMSAQGAGAPGTFSADVTVRFTDRGDGTTTVAYDADAMVGGVVGGVGQRMLGSVSKRMAGEFFGAVDRALSGAGDDAASGSGRFVTPGSEGGAGGDGAVGGAGDRAMPGVYVDSTRSGSSNDFVRGVVVGAGLVLAGVVAGVVASRTGSRSG